MTKLQLLSDPGCSRPGGSTVPARTGTATRYCVLYVQDRREQATPWFSTRDRAQIALRIMRARHGCASAIIYAD